VLMLEAHDVPGGYAHTFDMGEFSFCAQVHYIFGCGEGEPIHQFLSRIGVVDAVPFLRLDPEGFDHVVIDGQRFRHPSGLAKHRDRLLTRFPEAAKPLRRYFDTVAAVRDEMSRVPATIGLADVLTAPYEFYDLIRYRTWTLADFYDHVGMPPLLRGVLAGQCGDYLLPPSRASFLLHAAVVAHYDRGAFYPEHHYRSMIETIAGVIEAAPGCDLLYEREVEEILVEDGRVQGVRTADGEVHRARRYVSNADPARTAALAGEEHFPRAFLDRLDYEYSTSSFTVYLVLEGVDLRDHGFGRFNVWHYPHEDIDAIYRSQNEEGDFSDPWLFLSSPSLMSDSGGLGPPGYQILHVATSCGYGRFRALRDPYLMYPR